MNANAVLASLARTARNRTPATRLPVATTASASTLRRATRVRPSSVSVPTVSDLQLFILLSTRHKNTKNFKQK